MAEPEHPEPTYSEPDPAAQPDFTEPDCGPAAGGAGGNPLAAVSPSIITLGLGGNLLVTLGYGESVVAGVQFSEPDECAEAPATEPEHTAATFDEPSKELSNLNLVTSEGVARVAFGTTVEVSLLAGVTPSGSDVRRSAAHVIGSLTHQSAARPPLIWTMGGDTEKTGLPDPPLPIELLEVQAGGTDRRRVTESIQISPLQVTGVSGTDSRGAGPPLIVTAEGGFTEQIGLPAPPSATTVSFQGPAECEDTYIDESSPTANFGASSGLRTRESGSVTKRRPLVRFPSHGIPLSSIVNSATFSLWVRDDFGPLVGTRDIRVYRVLRDFTVGTVNGLDDTCNWTEYAGTQGSGDLWGFPGADQIGTDIDDTDVAETILPEALIPEGTLFTFDVRDVVQNMLDAGDLDFSFRVSIATNHSGTLIWRSTEEATTAERPKLEVTYQ